MGFGVSRSMFEGKLKKAYKTCVKHTICDLGHALLTHHEAPRIHKPHKRHLEGSGEHLGASCWPSGSHLGVLLGSCGAPWKLEYAYKTSVKSTNYRFRVQSLKTNVLSAAQKHYKTSVKSTIRDLGRALLDPPRGAKNAQASRMSPGGLQGTSWGLMWATWEPSGGLVGTSRGIMGALCPCIQWFLKNNPITLSRLNHKP